MTDLPEMTERRLQAIRAAMRTLVEEDLSWGVSPRQRGFCHGCRDPRPLPGFIDYGNVQLCTSCATEYEVGRAAGLVTSARAFVRDKAFGEESRYQLPHAAWHPPTPRVLRSTGPAAPPIAHADLSPDSGRSAPASPGRSARTAFRHA
jgi:hypothetical protein